MKSVKYTINDDVWTFSLLSKKDYQKKHGKDSYGLMDSEAFTIDFIKKKFSMKLLAHELWHLHMYYTFYERSYLKVGQLEETSAELFAYRGALIVKQAKEIYRKLKPKNDSSN